MIKIRRSEERGHAKRGWLNAYQTFSFGTYQDPEQKGFRVLRVLNDDRIAPGKGFGPHAHRDMEIITYVVEGNVLHRDSTGEQHVVGPNEIQVMSAGSGIVHSEFNASESELVRVLQIWIEPLSEDLKPSYQQITFAPDEKRGRFRLLAGPEPGNGATAAVINQDVRLYVAEMRPKETLSRKVVPQRHAWMQVVRGEISLNGQVLKEGDGAAISGEQELLVAGPERGAGEILLFDLP
jgi:redox-sensitive bicupin YhaK (pirin superfamily)